jgi:hypothetical protein
LLVKAEYDGNLVRFYQAVQASQKKLNDYKIKCEEIIDSNGHFSEIEKIQSSLLAIYNPRIINKFEYSTYYSKPYFYTEFSNNGKSAYTTYNEGGYRTREEFSGIIVTFEIENKNPIFTYNNLNVLVLFQTRGDLFINIGNLLFSKNGLNKDNVSSTRSVFDIKKLLPGEKRKINLFINKTFTRGVESLEPTIFLLINSFQLVEKEVLREKKMWPIEKKLEIACDKHGTFDPIGCVSARFKEK